mmetsp:Transcript_24451/g.30435  ORF Transcript_24451/g.30435 Transcript_24451/m.30435 type:complete len:208 (-) Transcript_24451:701-1324(-)
MQADRWVNTTEIRAAESRRLAILIFLTKAEILFRDFAPTAASSRATCQVIIWVVFRLWLFLLILIASVTCRLGWISLRPFICCLCSVWVFILIILSWLCFIIRLSRVRTFFLILLCFSRLTFFNCVCTVLLILFIRDFCRSLLLSILRLFFVLGVTLVSLVRFGFHRGLDSFCSRFFSLTFLGLTFFFSRLGLLFGLFCTIAFAFIS